jgi:hypothetical protein
VSPRSDKQRQKVLDQLELRLLKEAALWRDAFSTEPGQKCLDLLKANFYDVAEIASANEKDTIIRAAKRDLVRFIIDQIEFSGE